MDSLSGAVRRFVAGFGFVRSPQTESLRVDPTCDRLPGAAAPIVFRHNPRAKRYRLFVDRQGQGRVTIPKRGSRKKAERFAAENHEWLLQQLEKHHVRKPQAAWRLGSDVLLRGIPTQLAAGSSDSNLSLRLGAETINGPATLDDEPDLRSVVEGHLRKMAVQELPLRVCELAALHKLAVQKISIRNQRSRWGSCYRRGPIYMNLRLIQVPPEVCDYIILHELMHLREMNHSGKFWNCVAEVCPDYRQREGWLRQHAFLFA